MSSFDFSPRECFNIVYKLSNFSYPYGVPYTVNITNDDLLNLEHSCATASRTEDENKYDEPMVWVGIYITIASVSCIIAMASDLLHGFRKRKFWFPCKYFSLNAASITVITIAMKLPVDLSSPMRGDVDQATKLGSMAFMCTMMANLLPSLASMDNNTLLANIIGLVILVLTMIVNIYIQIVTGVVHSYYYKLPSKYNLMNCKTMAYIYMVLMLMLLIILISSALTIPTSKQILEFKYQATSKTVSNGQHTGMSTIEKLRQYVRRYWVMAESGSPQFVMASNPLSYASGIICVIGLGMYVVIAMQICFNEQLVEYRSEYKKSVPAIFIAQCIGVVVGSIAPIFRCFTVLSFKWFTKWNMNHLVVFKVEKHWTQQLYGWKEIRLPFHSSARGLRAIMHYFKNLLLSLCIGFQKVVVVSCKLIGLTRMVLLIFVLCCSYCWKSMKAFLFATPIASGSNDIDEDLSNYVLQIQDKMEFAEKTLEGISNSMNRLTQKVEKEQHNNLLELLEKSNGFEGVEKFDSDQIQPLLSVELVNSWSLPVLTLLCIVVVLPNICKDKVDNLFKSVVDGLVYTCLVEKSLNSASEYAKVRRAAMNLWHEVEDNYKWLGNTLERSAYKGKTSEEVLKWFADKAEEIVIEINKSTNGQLMESFPNKLIVANSMYRIARTILFDYQSNIEPISEEQLFEILSCMIADILSACLTNIPRVITTKCHESVIEKREASVETAAKLFGRSTEIITKLEARELPCMDPNKMAFIDEWHLHLKRSIP